MIKAFLRNVVPVVFTISAANSNGNYISVGNSAQSYEYSNQHRWTPIRPRYNHDSIHDHIDRRDWNRYHKFRYNEYNRGSEKMEYNPRNILKDPRYEYNTISNNRNY